ncbi:hypothetical protein F5148DRAFT_1168528 [Russula earlei]|uniref:Uncharacterized protein n=1 Tax=Russula earlei TaxID=71964 RepID=A0ACC0UJJ3_9AGAM|nr:hypothetical protein F5148DRAFT_1168528 [Russula earlei]
MSSFPRSAPDSSTRPILSPRLPINPLATASTHIPSHPSPTRDGSFLKAKGKDKLSPQSATDVPFPVRRAPSYFDRYPRQTSHPAPQSNLQRQHDPHGRVARPYGASTATLHSDLSSNSHYASDTMTTFGGRSDPHLSYSRHTHKDDFVLKPPTPRRRSRQYPNRSSGEHRSDRSHFRISDSSSLTQLETPPQTPIDLSTPKALFDPFSVVVSAPISGVETMDALVDGMNRFGKDDLFMGSGGISSRSTRVKDRFHPLYQPPLPTPPPGVTLGGGLSRSISSNERSSRHGHHDDDTDAANDADEDDEARPRISQSLSARRSSRSKPSRPSSPAIASGSSISPQGSPPPSPRHSRSDCKSVAPSISEIIRNYAPPEQQARSRPSTARNSMQASSHGHEIVYEEQESEPEPVSAAEEAELVSRTSVDSIAEEVRMTLRNQTTSPVVQAPLLSSQSSRSRHSFMSERSSGLASPGLDGRRTTPCHNGVDPVDQVDFTPPLTQSQAIAGYLRSVRLTTLLKLTRPPHASKENPLIVSLSDLGSSTGHPLVIFLGLGGVRYVSGLYDEMAECLGIRLITIDRWGIGRTQVPNSKTARGIPEWASAVEEILDLLHIDQCSVMAHSAGAPYALSFANKVPERVRGEILLLAPWVGGVEGAGYKWLKYVPTGILKTAQAAEWKIQAWMLGKPPTIAYKGIGYDARSALPTPPNTAPTRRSPDKSASPTLSLSYSAAGRRPSLGSSLSSDYDDLRDFEGRFDSRSTLGARSSGSQRRRSVSMSKPEHSFARKTSKGFLTRLKGGPQSQPSPEKPSPSAGGRKLKALRSMGSLRRSSTTLSYKAVTIATPPQVPPPLSIDVGLGLDAFNWANATGAHSGSPIPPMEPSNRRAAGRRSLSHSTPSRLYPPSLRSPVHASVPSSPTTSSMMATSAYQAALGNALIAAAHAESSRGTHGDLLQILNHDQQPWGFSYAAYPHTVRVWYGDRDEKIAENAVRWMERTMGPGRCGVQVVRGADHGLVYRSSVVVEVLERVRDIWEAVS